MPRPWLAFLGNCSGIAKDSGIAEVLRLRVEVPTLRWTLSVPVGNVRELPEHIQLNPETAVAQLLEYLDNPPEHCDALGLAVFVLFINPTLRQQ